MRENLRCDEITYTVLQKGRGRKGNGMDEMR